MKALTICQPYAHLCIHGEPNGALKRVENRSWYTSHRGPLVIHAGKSKQWLDELLGDDMDDLANYGIPLDRMAWGAVIGLVDVIDCVHYDKVDKPDVARRHPWLADHHHANGPWCWVLDNVRPMNPIPWKGAQGLWDIDPAALERASLPPQETAHV